VPASAQKSRMQGMPIRAFNAFKAAGTTVLEFDTHLRLPSSPPCALNRAPGHCANRRICTQRQLREVCNEALVTAQCLICRRIGISAADRIHLTSGRPRSTTTTAALPTGHVLELHDRCMRISATSARLHRSVVTGLDPGCCRRRHRSRCRYPNPRPPGYRVSRASRWDRARGSEYWASRTRTTTSRWWRPAWRRATLGPAVPRPAV